MIKGGLRIDTQARVLDICGKLIPKLYAAEEVGGTKLMREGWIHALLGGTVAGFTAVIVAHTPALTPGAVLTGVIAGVMVILVEALYLKLRGYKVIDRSTLNDKDLQTEKELSLLAALSPWIITIVLLFFVNLL